MFLFQAAALSAPFNRGADANSRRFLNFALGSKAHLLPFQAAKYFRGEAERKLNRNDR
jgi:hypothetical protein